MEPPEAGSRLVVDSRGWLLMFILSSGQAVSSSSYEMRLLPLVLSCAELRELCDCICMEPVRGKSNMIKYISRLVCIYATASRHFLARGSAKVHPQELRASGTVIL